MKKELAIIVPVYNEEMSIEKVIRDWSKVLPEVEFDLIIVNDGSIDKTSLVISKQKEKIKNLILINKINQGHGKAICDGYEFALKNNYNYIFQTDSDDQFFSSDFKKLWDTKNNENYDIVLGNRYKRNDPFLRLFLSKVVLHTLLKIFFKKKIIDPNIPFRLINSNFLKDFFKLNPKQFIAPNIIMTLHAKKILFIDVKHVKRSYGEISWSLKKLFKFGFILLKDLINYYFNLKKINEKN
jgi:dolichol-phosphate mannosyltransferase